MIRLTAILAALLCLTVPAHAQDDRTMVVREGSTGMLLNGAFSIEVIKLRGYRIDVRLNGTKQALKIGQSFQPDGSDCRVTFHKISPETRIARFKTDCP